MSSNTPADIGKWLDSTWPLHCKLTERLEKLLQEILNSSEVPYLSVTGRTKTVEGIAEKVRRKAYANPSEDVTDITGLRIIVYLNSDIHKCADIVRRHFDIDDHRSPDKGKTLGVDRMGYQSVHQVCKLTEERSKMPEFKQFTDLTFEVQIRTVLQHAWAEFEHDRNYKFRGVLPENITRKLNLYAGMLEIIDSGFQDLAEQINEFGDLAAQHVSSGDLDIEITTGSLKFYIKTSNKLNENIVEGDDHPSHWEMFIPELKAYGLSDLQAIENTISDEFLAKVEQSGGRVPCPLQFFRLLMLYDNIERYFNLCWNKNWAMFDGSNYDVLVSKYGSEIVDRFISGNGIHVAYITTGTNK